MIRILLVRLSAIGDCVLASPVPTLLRRQYPDAHITWIVEARAREVVEGLPGVDEVMVWQSRPSRAVGFLRSLLEVRRRKFDIALDLQGLAKAGAFLAVSGAKRRITGSRSKTLARSVASEIVPEISPPPHAVSVYLGRAGALAAGPADLKPIVPLTTANRVRALDFVEKHIPPLTPIIGFNLGASHPAKRWDPENFAAAADQLLPSLGAHGLVFAAPWEMNLVERMIGASKWRDRLHPVVGHSLLDLAALAERCVTFVSADTGPMHLAAAVGVPVVALFGPSKPEHTGPYGSDHRIVDAVQVLAEEGRPLPRATTRYGRRFQRVDDLSVISPQHVTRAALEIWSTGEHRLLERSEILAQDGCSVVS